MSPGKLPVRVEVNGREVEKEVEPRLLLSDFLRHEVGLTGTHVGCEHGVCGACTVLLDGEAIGKITSGGFGPSAGGPVAMGYVDAAHGKIGTALGLMVRGKKLPATVVKLPFAAHRYHKDQEG